MDNELIDQCQSCVDDLTPVYFDGLRVKQRERYGMFFSDVIFTGMPIRTTKKKIVWHEQEELIQNFIPPVVCPCDDFQYVSNQETWDEYEAKFPYMQLGAEIGCDFICQNGPGVYCNDQGDELGVAIRKEFAKKQAFVDRAFDNIKNLWAAQAFIDGKVTITGPNIKPYTIEFPRCPTLTENLSGDDCWGKNKCGNPLSDIDMMNNRMFCKGYGNVTDNLVMTQETCDAMLLSPDMQDCFKSFNPRLQLPDIVAGGGANQQPEAPYFGAKLAFTLRMDGGRNLNIWCVNAFFDFVDPVSNQKIKTNLLPYGKIIGWDSRAYRAKWAYGGIFNMHAGDDRRRERFARAWITENGKSMKYTSESAPLPMIECPNASWCLNVCPKKKG